MPVVHQPAHDRRQPRTVNARFSIALVSLLADCEGGRSACSRGIGVYQGVDNYGWDGHDNNKVYAERNAHQTDQTTAALLTDLKQRGLLDDTLVVRAGEFGRTPMLQGTTGRNHNPYSFTGWLAGGGVKGARHRRDGRHRPARRAGP